MSERRLASIMTVKEIADIEGKDKIGYVSFVECGWQVIGSKDLHVGEKVLYVEYDAILSEAMLSKMPQELSETLKKRCWSNKWGGCLIRAMKMAGKVSYGIMFRGPEIYPYLMSKEEWDRLKAGDVLTERLGVLPRRDDFTQIAKKDKAGFFKKWWSILLWKLFKIQKKKSGLGQWVPFMSKTDETRLQALSNSIFDELQGKKVYVSEKLDGQSLTVAIFKKRFYICSRNQCLYNKPLKKAIKELIPVNAANQHDRFIATACKYNLAKRMADVQGDMFGYNDWALQGEQVGPGIQGNPCQLGSIELFVFNVFNISSQNYLSRKVIEETVKTLNNRGLSSASDLQTVPILQREIPFTWKTVVELEELSKGKTFNGKGKHREGIVVRADTDLCMLEPMRGMSNMLSFKVINPDFILNKKD